MKVKELQQKLSSLNPELELLCYTEDERLLTDRRGFLLLDIESVEITDAEHVRLDDGTPYLKLGKGPASTTVATLHVTSDF
jgi:hypothetical protein